MPTPVIGLTLRPLAANGYPAMLVRNRAYFDALEGAGAAVLPIPVTANEQHLRALYERCDALCLPGGPDVAPRLYGQEARTDCNVDVDPELDQLERPLLEWALADDKPVLAICRGMQLLNVLLGGTLWQDIAVQVDGSLQHQHESRFRDMMHTVAVDPSSQLHEIVQSDSIEVNSRHHQAVRDAAVRLTVSAHAPDGVIEALEDRSRRFMVALQCHPEDLYGRFDWARRLFGGLVTAAGG